MSGADTGLCMRPARESASFKLGDAPAARLLWALIAATAGFIACGCSSTTANLEISAPLTVVAGAPFSVTVSAMAAGRTDTIFNSPIHFSSSDSAAILPPDYAFTTADAGSHTFNGVTLMTAGSQSIKVTDNIAPSLNATAKVMVTTATTESQSSAPYLRWRGEGKDMVPETRPSL